jgi:hypothetical protein
MKKLLEFLTQGCWHTYKAVKVYHYRDVSWMTKGEAGAPSTNITFQCSKCHKIYTQDLYGSGYIELEELEQ